MLNIIVTRLFPCIIFSLSRIEANLFQLHDIISISIDICVWKNSFLDSFVSRNYSKNFYPEIGLRLLKNSTYHFARTRDRILLKFVFKNQNHGASWLKLAYLFAFLSSSWWGSRCRCRSRARFCHTAKTFSFNTCCQTTPPSSPTTSKTCHEDDVERVGARGSLYTTFFNVNLTCKCL